MVCEFPPLGACSLVRLQIRVLQWLGPETWTIPAGPKQTSKHEVIPVSLFSSSTKDLGSQKWATPPGRNAFQKDGPPDPYSGGSNPSVPPAFGPSSPALGIEGWDPIGGPGLCQTLRPCGASHRDRQDCISRMLCSFLQKVFDRWMDFERSDPPTPALPLLPGDGA